MQRTAKAMNIIQTKLAHTEDELHGLSSAKGEYNNKELDFKKKLNKLRGEVADAEWARQSDNRQSAAEAAALDQRWSGRHNRGMARLGSRLRRRRLTELEAQKKRERADADSRVNRAVGAAAGAMSKMSGYIKDLKTHSNEYKSYVEDGAALASETAGMLAYGNIVADASAAGWTAGQGGENAGLPPSRNVYADVGDLDVSAAALEAQGQRMVHHTECQGPEPKWPWCPDIIAASKRATQ